MGMCEKSGFKHTKLEALVRPSTGLGKWLAAGLTSLNQKEIKAVDVKT